MEQTVSLREILTQVFTDDPINWVKWLLVFAVLVGGYWLMIPIYAKVTYALSWDRKRDMAAARGHVIPATMQSCWRDRNAERGYDYHASYTYMLEGKVKTYQALFLHGGYPPRQMDLYYLRTPRRLFTPLEYHYENHKGLLLLPIVFGPWLLAAGAAWLLRIPGVGA